MADVKVTTKPLVPIDATTQFIATKDVSGVRTVVQIAQSDLRGLDGKSSLATIGGTPPAIPAVGVQVQYAVDSSSGFVVDQIVSVGSAATLKVVSLPSATSIVLENVDATPGAVAVGAKILPSGKKGAAGANGLDSTVPGPAGANAFTTVTTGFTIPAYNAQVTVTVGSTAFMSVGMALQIGGVFFRVAAITNATTVSLTNSVAGQTGIIAALARVAVAGETGPAGAPGAAGNSGVSGLQYTNLNTAGTPTAGQIRSADINAVGLSTVSISATDAQATPKSTADVLARLKVGAIIEIAASNTNKVRGTISTDYSSGSNSFNWSGQIVSGSIANNSTVYLSIISDPVSINSGGGGLTTQVITASQTALDGVILICDSSAELEIIAPSTGSKFGVANLGSGGYKVKKSPSTLLQLGASIVSSDAKSIKNSLLPSYVEFVKLGNIWLATTVSNAQYDAGIVNFTKSLIHFNELVGATPADSALNSRTISFGFGASITVGGKFGNGATIQNNQYCEINLPETFGTENFCIEWFSNPLSSNNYYNVYMSLYRGTQTQFSGGALSVDPTTGTGGILFLKGEQIEVAQGGSSGTSTNLFSGTSKHMALTRAGNVFSHYIDGVLKSTLNAGSSGFASTFGASLGAGLVLRFGGIPIYSASQSDQGVPQIIDEVRISIGDSIYNAAFTPPIAEFVYP